MEFRILGPLDVLAGGSAVPLPGAKPRAVLALLLVHAGRPVGADRIAQALWGEDAPSGAANTVQVHVSRLRKALGGADAIGTRRPGTRCGSSPARLDAQRFEAGLEQGRAELEAGRPERAAEALERALAEWRGPPLGEFAEHALRRPRARAAGGAARGRARSSSSRRGSRSAATRRCCGQLEALIAEHPYRERPRAQLMLALYRSDRQAEALEAYQDARRALVEELGIEPGERLRELERAILAQDPALAAPALAAEAPAPAPPPPEPRRRPRRAAAGERAERRARRVRPGRRRGAARRLDASARSPAAP